MMRVFYRAFISLKSAVSLLLILALSLAVGTVIESLTDTPTARYWVYSASWFHGLLLLLGVMVLLVALSRWPWKSRHIPFLLAHAGILILLFGSARTWLEGLDGRLILEEGQTSGLVELDDLVLTLTEGQRTQTFAVPWIPPGRPLDPIEISDFGVQIDEFLPHADPQIAFSPSSSQNEASAIRLILEGGMLRAPEQFWLWGGDLAWSSLRMGPASFLLVSGDKPLNTSKAPGTGLVFQVSHDREEILYQGHSARSGGFKGKISFNRATGFEIKTPWMAGTGKPMTVRISEFIAHARNDTRYVASRVQYGNEASLPAILVQETWLGVGDRVAIEVDGREVMASFARRRVMLPFALELERFDVTFYPGSDSPSEFASRVRLAVPNAPLEPLIVSMNEPLEWGDYTFYQASYVPAEPRPIVSILSVNRDPGRFWKYLGSILLVLGSALLFASRYRKKGRTMVASPEPMHKLVPLVAVLLTFSAEATEILPKGPEWSFREAGLIPIHSGGRVKPLDTFARETALFVTGRRSFEHFDAVDLLFSWMTEPQLWESTSFIRVLNKDLKRQLLLDESKESFSPVELLHHPVLLQYLDSAMGGFERTSLPIEQTGRQNPRRDEMKKLIERIGLFRAVVSGQAWTIIPSSDPQGSWKPLSDRSLSQSTVVKSFADLAQAYMADDPERFRRTAALSHAAIEGEILDFKDSDRNILVLESAYHRVRPFFLAWVFYLAAAIAWLWVAWRESGLRLARQLGLLFGGLAFVVHVAGFAARCLIAGRPPVSNMYESVVWVSLGAFVFACVLYFKTRKPLLMVVGASIATLGLIAADVSPAVLDPGIHPLVPVLRSNFWLTIHVLTITLSYGAFALAFGVGNVTLARFLARSPHGERIRLGNDLAYRAMQIGVVLLAAGTILGGVWADYSWGRFWGWDPKETWALIALLCYLAILHARFAGWLGTFGFAVGAVLAFVSVVMAWYGVNFILGVGLHSYGFSSGGTPWVLGAVGLNILFVLSVVLVKRVRGSRV